MPAADALVNRKSPIANSFMSILVTPQTKVLVQGITGSFGARHTQLSLAYGTRIVAGVTPGKGGQLFEKQVPIFDTVAAAAKQTAATASAIFVPPPFAGDAILEAIDAELDLVVCITEGIPVNDMVKVKRAMEVRKTRTARALSPPAKARIPPGAAASASRPDISTGRDTSASSHAAARSPTKRSGSSPAAVSAKAPASESGATRSMARRTSTSLKCSMTIPTRTASS